jgi:superfamily II DNA or RNA helicase
MAYMRFPLKTHLLQGTLKPFPFLQLRFNSTAITYSMLRPYQKECINMTLEELEKGARKQVVSLPVGMLKCQKLRNSYHTHFSCCE